MYIPINLEGEREQVVFEVAHRKPNSELHWHLDDVYLGTTQANHVLALTPPAGEHIITVIDEEGHRLLRNFTVLEKVGK